MGTLRTRISGTAAAERTVPVLINMGATTIQMVKLDSLFDMWELHVSGSRIPDRIEPATIMVQSFYHHTGIEGLPQPQYGVLYSFSAPAGRDLEDGKTE